MNNTQIILKIIRFTIVSLLLGILMHTVTAQTKKEEPKKAKTRVEVKIIKEDEKGNVTRIDTSYEVSGEENMFENEIQTQIVTENDMRFPFGMGMTPWGQITKFEIKEKKHGKVIRIETNDDGMMMMCPPPPPPPGKIEKKIIRISEDDINKEGKEKVIIMEKKGKPEMDRNE